MTPAASATASATTPATRLARLTRPSSGHAASPGGCRKCTARARATAGRVRRFERRRARIWTPCGLLLADSRTCARSTGGRTSWADGGTTRSFGDAVVLVVSDLDRAVKLYGAGFGLDLHVDDHRGDDPWTSGRHAATSWTDGAFMHFACRTHRRTARRPKARRSPFALRTSKWLTPTVAAAART